MRNVSREPRSYELLTILSPEVGEEELPGALERISGYVAAVGGNVQETSRESPWGRRRLAYPIRHAGRDVRDGFYTLFRLQLVPSRVEEMERELKLDTQLMRYLVTVYTPVPLDPRAIEDAEFAAEDAAAAAYAAAQAEAARLVAGQAAPADMAAAPTLVEDAPAAATIASAPAEQAPPPAATVEPAAETLPPPAAQSGDPAQPIQGAAGVAGQSPATGSEDIEGEPSAGIQRADNEAAQAGPPEQSEEG